MCHAMEPVETKVQPKEGCPPHPRRVPGQLHDAPVLIHPRVAGNLNPAHKDKLPHEHEQPSHHGSEAIVDGGEGPPLQPEHTRLQEDEEEEVLQHLQPWKWHRGGEGALCYYDYGIDVHKLNWLPYREGEHYIPPQSLLDTHQLSRGSQTPCSGHGSATFSPHHK